MTSMLLIVSTEITERIQSYNRNLITKEATKYITSYYEIPPYITQAANDNNNIDPKYPALTLT
jgi:hypothetical protein